MTDESPRRGDFLMFTGIITNTGKFIRKEESIFTFNIDPTLCRKLKKGMSIAVNGTCLTVFKKPSKNSFSAEIMPETRNKTTLGYLKINDLVNLELPATPMTLLSGHIVQGHVDTVAKLTSIEKQG
ncbi:riboflavin synthase, partial [Candidatus Daviesbacteria bacterium]|nr:riboflavin synthase [Candidatus Daviesbacteria bacterium]